MGWLGRIQCKIFFFFQTNLYKLVHTCIQIHGHTKTQSYKHTDTQTNKGKLTKKIKPISRNFEWVRSCQNYFLLSVNVQIKFFVHQFFLDKHSNFNFYCLCFQEQMMIFKGSTSQTDLIQVSFWTKICIYFVNQTIVLHLQTDIISLKEMEPWIIVKVAQVNINKNNNNDTKILIIK